MIGRVCLAAVALLACGSLASGCGGSDKSSKNAGAQPAAQQATTDTTGAPPATTESAGATPTTASAAIKLAVENCKKSVDQAQVKENVKSDLRNLCEKAASGDRKAVEKASREICHKVVESSVPAGDARTQALASCDASTTTP
jgi:predicted lipid-binding transport protein (Tim44 family)